MVATRLINPSRGKQWSFAFSNSGKCLTSLPRLNCASTSGLSENTDFVFGYFNQSSFSTLSIISSRMFHFCFDTEIRS